jgi:plasmid stabilization system protein ParE
MKVRVTPEAFNDIKQIKNYISEEFDNSIAANRIVNKITKSYRNLEKSPYIGKRLITVVGTESDYRFLICGNHLIFYIIEGNNISVERVIHSKRDYCKLLNINIIDDLTEEQ